MKLVLDPSAYSPQRARIRVVDLLIGFQIGALLYLWVPVIQNWIDGFTDYPERILLVFAVIYFGISAARVSWLNNSTTINHENKEPYRNTSRKPDRFWIRVLEFTLLVVFLILSGFLVILLAQRAGMI